MEDIVTYFYHTLNCRSRKPESGQLLKLQALYYPPTAITMLATNYPRQVTVSRIAVLSCHNQNAKKVRTDSQLILNSL